MKKFKITVDGKEYDVQVEELRDGAPSPGVVAPAPVPPPRAVPAPQQERPQTPVGSGAVTAPMPGTILKVLVKTGDRVEYGQALVILEAMKMENSINATATGTVAGIEVGAGDNVETGQLLLTIG